MRVLEPSAGQGHIAYMASGVYGCAVTAIEIDRIRSAALRYWPGKPKLADVWTMDFLCVRYPPEQRFERVLMNPPFNPNLDVTHVLHAWDNALAEGGRLLAIITPRFKKRTDAKSARLRKLIADHGFFLNLPDNKSPGATLKTVLVVLDAPSFK